MRRDRIDGAVDDDKVEEGVFLLVQQASCGGVRPPFDSHKIHRSLRTAACSVGSSAGACCCFSIVPSGGGGSYLQPLHEVVQPVPGDPRRGQRHRALPLLRHGCGVVLLLLLSRGDGAWRGRLGQPHPSPLLLLLPLLSHPLMVHLLPLLPLVEAVVNHSTAKLHWPQRFFCFAEI